MPARIARAALVALVVAAPWPFGSATPRFAAALTAALCLLFASLVVIELTQKARIAQPPGLGWMVAGLSFIVFQLLPVPGSLSAFASPASHDVYAALETELASGRWHPISVEPFETLWGLVQLLGLGFAFYLSSRLFRRSDDRAWLAVSATLAGVALSLFAVYQSAKFGTVLYGRFPTVSGKPFGPFVNHNHFAGYVEACALVALGAGIGHARRSGAIGLLFGGSAVMMAIAVVLSGSRGGMVAAGFGIVVLAWLSNGSQRFAKHALAAGGVASLAFVVLFAPAGTFERWSRLGRSEDTSAAFRVQLWSDSAGLAARSLVAGSGLGTYAAIVPGYRSGPDETRAEHAESDWLELACEAGAIGLFLVFGFFGVVGRTASRALQADPSSRSRSVRHGLVAAAAALIVHGLVDFNFRIPSNALLFVVILGAIAPASNRSFWRERRRRRQGLALVVLGAGALLAATTWAMGESRRLNRRIDPLLTEPGDFTTTLQTLGRSRNRVPFNPRTDFLIGRLYNEEAYRSLEEVRYREIRLRQAVDAFRIAVGRAPARGRYWFELGWTEANRGNRELADRLFSRALHLEPHWADLRANYALYLVTTGRTDEALAELARARALRPGLRALDALGIIGPHVEQDIALLRAVAGNGEEGDQAIAQYLGTTRP